MINHLRDVQKRSSAITAAVKPRLRTVAAPARAPQRENRFRIARYGALVVALGLACLTCLVVSSRIDSGYDVTSSVRFIPASAPVSKRNGTYRIGDPYVIAGRTYTPREEPDYRAEGTASWYGDKFHGRPTANGEIFDTFSLSAAHPTLPLPSYVRVTNLENHRSLVVRLNDRGPYHDNRLIDVSVRTAKLLGFYDQGLAQVRVDYVGPAELEGSDDSVLAATLSLDDLAAAEMSGKAQAQPSQAPTWSHGDDVDASAPMTVSVQMEIPN
jgi:peptidoglycan lytic transglycosylase